MPSFMAIGEGGRGGCEHHHMVRGSTGSSTVGAKWAHATCTDKEEQADAGPHKESTTLTWRGDREKARLALARPAPCAAAK